MVLITRWMGLKSPQTLGHSAFLALLHMYERGGIRLLIMSKKQWNIPLRITSQLTNLKENKKNVFKILRMNVSFEFQIVHSVFSVNNILTEAIGHLIYTLIFHLKVELHTITQVSTMKKLEPPKNLW